MEYRIGALLSGKGVGDGTVIGHLGKKAGLGKESFDDKSRHGDQTSQESQASEVRGITGLAIAFFIIEIVFYILIGSIAAYLSWTSNASIGWHPAFCVLFSIIAFFCAATYIIGHVLFKLDLLSALKVGRMLAQGRASNGMNGANGKRAPFTPTAPALPAP